MESRPRAEELIMKLYQEVENCVSALRVGKLLIKYIKSWRIVY